MKTITTTLLLAALVFQTGCMSSPISAKSSSFGFPEWAMMGVGTAAGAGLGQMAMGDRYGGIIGSAIGMAGTAAYMNYQSQQQAQLVAEAKEEARREERAILMRDYWVEATGANYVGQWAGKERDVRYEAGVVDGLRYENRSLSRQLYFQEPSR